MQLPVKLCALSIGHRKPVRWTTLVSSLGYFFQCSLDPSEKFALLLQTVFVPVIDDVCASRDDHELHYMKLRRDA